MSHLGAHVRAHQGRFLLVLCELLGHFLGEASEEAFDIRVIFFSNDDEGLLLGDVAL